MKRAIVDVDGTLWDLHGLVLPILHKKFGVPNEYPSEWNFYKEYCDDDEFYAVVDDIHERQIAYSPFDGADDLFWALYGKGYQIIVASHRKPHFTYQLARWLDGNLPRVWTGVYAGPSKLFMIGQESLVIDDSPSTIQYALEARAESLSLTWPWNSGTGGLKFNSLLEMAEWIRQNK